MILCWTVFLNSIFFHLVALSTTWGTQIRRLPFMGPLKIPTRASATLWVLSAARINHGGRAWAARATEAVLERELEKEHEQTSETVLSPKGPVGKGLGTKRARKYFHCKNMEETFQISSDREEKELHSAWESSAMVLTEAPGKDHCLPARDPARNALLSPPLKPTQIHPSSIPAAPFEELERARYPEENAETPQRPQPPAFEARCISCSQERFQPSSQTSSFLSQGCLQSPPFPQQPPNNSRIHSPCLLSAQADKNPVSCPPLGTASHLGETRLWTSREPERLICSLWASAEAFRYKPIKFTFLTSIASWPRHYILLLPLQFGVNCEAHRLRTSFTTAGEKTLLFSFHFRGCFLSAGMF